LEWVECMGEAARACKGGRVKLEGVWQGFVGEREVACLISVSFESSDSLRGVRRVRRVAPLRLGPKMFEWVG
jgi:hypothetical protein